MEDKEPLEQICGIDLGIAIWRYRAYLSSQHWFCKMWSEERYTTQNIYVDMLVQKRMLNIIKIGAQSRTSHLQDYLLMDRWFRQMHLFLCEMTLSLLCILWGKVSVAINRDYCYPVVWCRKLLWSLSEGLSRLPCYYSFRPDLLR